MYGSILRHEEEGDTPSRLRSSDVCRAAHGANKEIKRRAAWSGCSPTRGRHPAIGAVLADMHDEWHAGDRRYLSETSMARLYPDPDSGPAATINSGE